MNIPTSLGIPGFNNPLQHQFPLPSRNPIQTNPVMGGLTIAGDSHMSDANNPNSSRFNDYEPPLFD